jgi:hypothetical protein
LSDIALACMSSCCCCSTTSQNGVFQHHHCLLERVMGLRCVLNGLGPTRSLLPAAPPAVAVFFPCLHTPSLSATTSQHMTEHVCCHALRRALDFHCPVASSSTHHRCEGHFGHKHYMALLCVRQRQAAAGFAAAQKARSCLCTHVLVARASCC